MIEAHDWQNRFPPDTIDWMIVEGVEVKRDDDLVRRLLLDIEASSEPIHLFALHMNMTADERTTYYHLKLLADAGFLEETGARGGTFRITNAGHDFLAAIRDEGSWGKVKAASRALGGVGLGMLKEIGLGYLRAKAVEMGVPLG